MKDIRIAGYAARYLEELSTLLGALHPKDLEAVVRHLEDARERGGTIYIIGNGGSASIASHMANDWAIGIRRPGVRPLRVVSLADNVSTVTALGNDMGYDSVFVEQLRCLLMPGDVVVALSVSGNSPNILRAVEFARDMDVTVIGWTGFDGGQLKNLAHLAVHVENPKGVYGPVEDVFMILDHLIYSYYKFEHYGA